MAYPRRPGEKPRIEPWARRLARDHLPLGVAAIRMKALFINCTLKPSPETPAPPSE